MLRSNHKRVAQAVVVRADPDRVTASAGDQRHHGRGGDPRLVAEQEHDPVGVLAHPGESGADRGGAAVAEVGVDHDVDAGEVDGLAHRVCGPAESHDDLVEGRRPRGGEGGVEQRRSAVGKQLLGPPQATRATGRKHEGSDGHEAWSAR